MALTTTRTATSPISLEDLQRAITEDQNFRYWLIGLLNESFPSRMETHQLIQQMREETDRQIAAIQQQIAAIREETAAIQQQIAVIQQQIAAIREETAAIQQQIAVIQQQIAAIREETAAYRERTDREIIAIREEMAAYREKTDQQMAAFREEMAAYREKTDQQMAAFREEMAALRREFQQGIQRVEATLGALGARWGMMAEEAFRSGMAAILKDRLGWKVERFLALDPEGFVFGQSDQVEIDVVIHDGFHWLVEIRSSMSKPDMYVFARKVAFYEKLKGVKVGRRIVISPMVHPQAMAAAEQMGIEVYTSAYNVS